MRKRKTYYWANGEKIPLEDAHQIAVDLPAARHTGLWEGELKRIAAESGSEVTADLLLIPDAEMPKRLQDRLREAGAAHPVFRHDDTLLIVFPEVRVETGDSRTADALQSVVEDWANEVVVDQPKPGRFVLRPVSHRGDEALELANRVSERVKPDAVQARFLRLVPEDARSDLLRKD